MDELNKEVNTMEINANITDAARQLVRTSEIEDGQSHAIPGYRGMCVCLADSGADIQAMDFFTEGNRRYAIGPCLN